MNDWITLTPKTTPELGRIVLAFYVNGAGKGRTVRAMLVGPKQLVADDDAPDEWWDEDEGDFYAPAGWYEVADNAESCWPIQPTHWQPLPAPPA